MLRTVLTSLILAAVLVVAAGADDLYRVLVNSQHDAQVLKGIDLTPVLRIRDGYLILADPAVRQRLVDEGLATEWLASGVRLSEMAVDHHPREMAQKTYGVLYEEDDLRLLRIDRAALSDPQNRSDLIPVMGQRPEIFYRPSFSLGEGIDARHMIALDSLVGLVSEDTVTDNLLRLEAFYAYFPDSNVYHNRLAGTDSNYAARDWIAQQFISYGYDSVMLDPFELWGFPCYNVAAVKPGTVWPEYQVIVGGHFDAVYNSQGGSPGADDNGTGTIAVLEMARVLADIDTKMSFVFIAFDAEEMGLVGSRHYAQAAYDRGDNIVFMLNLDMIGHIDNDSLARLYNGVVEAYSLLWRDLALPLVGIDGVLWGTSGRSDHAPFLDHGWDAIFVHEYLFSTVYHTPRDSSTMLNFDYMTRMIKASLATAYTVSELPPPVSIVSVLDVGDGQSLQIDWEPIDPATISECWIKYRADGYPAETDSVAVSPDLGTYVVDGLLEGVEYTFSIVLVDQQGVSSLVIWEYSGTPYSIPVSPEGLSAWPLKDAIKLVWFNTPNALDFDHYGIIRDGHALPAEIFDTAYVDDDPALGSDLHRYFVVAVDQDGIRSDTNAALAIEMRTATLDTSKMLAINRTNSGGITLADCTITSAFLHEALAPYAFDYISDSLATQPMSPDTVGLLDLIDYGLIVIGAESMYEDFGLPGGPGYLLDDVGHYLSIGGKAIVFGRWGDLLSTDTIDYTDPYSHGLVYFDWFHISGRIHTLTELSGLNLTSDMIGAHGQPPDYPDLSWDSLVTADHSSPLEQVSGIPCVSFDELVGDDVDVIYTYNSSDDGSYTEGQPVAWRYLGEDYQYVYFDVPLSFMQRGAAVAALRAAVADLLPATTGADDDGRSGEPIPTYELSQNFPNPFNPSTEIRFSLPRAGDVKLVIYNILGRAVRVLVDGYRKHGEHSVVWDGTNSANAPAASGIYFYRLEAGDVRTTKKMVLIR